MKSIHRGTPILLLIWLHVSVLEIKLLLDHLNEHFLPHNSDFVSCFFFSKCPSTMFAFGFFYSNNCCLVIISFRDHIAQFCLVVVFNRYFTMSSLTYTWLNPDRRVVVMERVDDAVNADLMTDFNIENFDGVDNLDRAAKQSAGLFPLLHNRAIVGVHYYSAAAITAAVGADNINQECMTSIRFAQNLLHFYNVAKSLNVDITPEMVYAVSAHILMAFHYCQAEQGVNALSVALYADYVCFYTVVQLKFKLADETLDPFLEMDSNGTLFALAGHRQYELDLGEGKVAGHIAFPDVHGIHHRMM